ncbi:hypothetical protein Cme02nite_38180 [Catellatospora methionotrophica]|uniref:Uncharacterized protein n=1 Tax=Catellatospora methionotrophica TaxID=121620 RepID=A0A8J3LHX7_9ACTN|nr:hypothetical protein [Catellatospora methionotrophica]GIG15486.1 hypothetical protein Cme02nite_38180 [Catellatospora methionotrophica]
MGIGIDGLTAAVSSHAQALGVFERFNGAEPKNSPGAGLSGACWVQDLLTDTTGSGLAATGMVLIYNVRLYMHVDDLAPETLDPAMVKALDLLFGAYIGDFTLGGLIRNVDVRGAKGTPLGGRAGYQQIEAGVFRVFTITLPLVVNDVWAEAS